MRCVGHPASVAHLGTIRPMPARIAALRWTLEPLGLLLLTRIGLMLVTWAALRAQPTSSLGDLLSNWDGNWNQTIADLGYVELPLGGAIAHPWMTLAFLPFLPMSTRAIDAVTGIGVVPAGLLVSWSTGIVGVVLLWRLVQQRYGERIASASILLLLVSPHGFVLAMMYTEGPMLLAVALVFWFLRDRRWELAGLAALAGGLMRPNGFVLVVPCAVAAWLAWRETRSLRPWVAPALAPLGFVAWLGFAWARTGEPLGYFEVQREGWGAGIDFGLETLQSFGDVVMLRWDDANVVVSVLSITLGAIGVVLAFRRRLDPTWSWYALALLVLTIVNERQASAGRFLLPAFPIFVAWTLTIRERWRSPVTAMSACVMGGLWFLASTEFIFTP
jgi:Dolichyl-phosphate-mannose-protein mannosyltransferase